MAEQKWEDKPSTLHQSKTRGEYRKQQISESKSHEKKKELAKKIKENKKMPEGHNRISSGGTITNRLYPGGFNGKK